MKKCSHKVGKIKGIILISKYMIKRYGIVEALNRMAKYKYKYKSGLL